MTHSWCVAVRVLGHHFKIKGDVIDGDGVLPGKILGGSREESLGEEETTDPEDSWGAVIEPVLRYGRREEEWHMRN